MPATSPSRRTLAATLPALAGAGFLVLPLAGLVSCQPAPSPSPSPASEYLNTAPEVGYVGMNACRGCHMEIASSYAKVGMGRAWYPMSPAMAEEDWTDNNEIHVEKTGLRYRMIERDGRYFQRQFVLDSAGRELAADEREVIQVVGSGNHGRIYVTKVDGKLYQMPVAWYSERQIWDLAPGFQHNNLHFTREVTQECTYCHNATMVPVPGTRNQYEEPIPEGIDCERCHGPGELHVDKWTTGDVVPTGDKDPTIVNPRRLPRSLRLQICYQCHLGGSETGERPEKEGKLLYDFRPGLSILEVMVPFGYEHPMEREFNVTGQVDRMVRSRCYTESDGKLECLTCHNPHVTVYREDREPDFFRRKCLGCHQEMDCPAPEATRATTEETPDDCVACHMRKAEPTDHPHTELIDHWIRKRIVVNEDDVRTEYAFAPILPETADLFPPEELAFYRGRTSFLKTFQTQRGSEHRTALRTNADAAFREAIAGGMDTANAWFYMGKNLTYMRRLDQAVDAFRQALARDPDHHNAAYELGAGLMNLQRVPEAAEVFREMLARDPLDPSALADLGRCELSMNRPLEALSLFQRALAEDPNRASLFANMGAALAGMQRWNEALDAAARAASLNPEDPAIWNFYANLLRQTGRTGEANEVERHSRLLATVEASRGASPTL